MKNENKKRQSEIAIAAENWFRLVLMHTRHKRQQQTENKNKDKK